MGGVERRSGAPFFWYLLMPKATLATYERRAAEYADAYGRALRAEERILVARHAALIRSSKDNPKATNKVRSLMVEMDAEVVAARQAHIEAMIDRKRLGPMVEVARIAALGDLPVSGNVG